ncbi:MAG: ATP-binding protein [Clostridia bacterium]|nr:ATP-binding protein [Clostridia bacterium]
MNNSLYRQIKKEYDIKRQIAIDKANTKKNNIYLSMPKLQELEDEKNKLAIKCARHVLNSNEITRQIELENLELKIAEYEKKIEKVLKENSYSKQDFLPEFECKICGDTGIIDKNKSVKYCSCFMQKLINQSYKQSNINKLQEENFDTFDIGYYSPKVDKEKYGIDKSPLENIETIKKLSKKFSQNIEDRDQKNLLFVGKTGLGKTFLANCIANEVIKNCGTVVYQTAPILMDTVMDYKFSYEKDEFAKQQYNNIFEVDLLIIDDLGTETMSNHKFTELFNIINTRLLNNKKIIISTNLTLNELYKEYDERVMSRLIGNFIICRFIGDDIRLKKKKISV